METKTARCAISGPQNGDVWFATSDSKRQREKGVGGPLPNKLMTWPEREGENAKQDKILGQQSACVWRWTINSFSAYVAPVRIKHV